MKSADASRFTIVMKVRLFVREYFELIVKGFGQFQLTNPESLQQPEVKQQINQNAPAIMFPYMRAFITTLTAQMGQSMPPLVLPVQFFQGELPEIAAP
jgi:preprotein translocase subunit SecB